MRIMEDNHMNSDVIKKVSRLTLLGLASIGLFACNDASSTSEDPTESSTSEEKDLLSSLQSMKENQNYTATANDDLGSMTQYFMSDFYAYKFDGVSSTTMFGYCEDDLGIYQINVNFNTGRVIKQGYYEVDQYGNKVKGLYDNVAYSLKDLSFNTSDYEEKDDKLYIKNLRSDDALVLYFMFGYQESDVYSNIYFSNVEDIYFEFTEARDIKMSLVFNASSLMNPSTMVFSDIDSTKKPSCYDAFYEAGNKGKIRVENGDKLFAHLASLKNMRNYTVNIESDYNVTEYGDRNYTTTLMFANDCYYSTSSRDTDSDLGFIVQDGVVKSCLIDAVSKKLIVGDTYLDGDGNTKTNIFDTVYSFYDLDWNEYTIGAVDAGENKWNIDDSGIITTFAYISNDTFLRYQWQSIDFTYDPVNLEYHFLCNLTDGESLTIDVVDVNKTVIYQE